MEANQVPRVQCLQDTEFHLSPLPLIFVLMHPLHMHVLPPCNVLGAHLCAEYYPHDAQGLGDAKRAALGQRH